MEQIVAVTMQKAVGRRPSIIVTTFYELVKAISGELKPGEEDLLSIVVMDLFASGRLKVIGSTENLKNIMKQLSKDDLNVTYVKTGSTVPVDYSTGDNYHILFEANCSPPVAGL